MRTLVLTLTAGLLSTVCPAQTPEHSFKETFNISAPAILAISTADGNIDIKPGSDDKVEVYVIARKNNKVLKVSRQEVEKELMLNIETTGNHLSITVKYPNTTGPFGNDRMQLDFKIYAPVRTASDLNSADGNIAVNGLTGAQKAKTSDGNVQFSKVKGDVSGSTSDGNIQAEDVTGTVTMRTSDGNIQLSRIMGNAEATTGDGNISVTSITGECKTKTSDGDISINAHAGALSASSSDGNIKATVITPKDAVTLHTDDGNVELTLPDGIGLDLDIHGKSLNVPVKNFTGRSDEKTIQGKMNGGGVRVKLSTDGNVAVRMK